MTGIAYFGTNHGHGRLLEVLAKLEELKPDFITLESIPDRMFVQAKSSRRDFYAEYGYRRGRLFVGNFFEAEDPEEQALIRYAFGKYPVFLIDSYRHFAVLRDPVPLPEEQNAIFGLMPSGKIEIIDLGLHRDLPLRADSRPYVPSGNLAMGHNINKLVELYRPSRVAHFGGRGHYDGRDNSIPLQDVVRAEIKLMWDIPTNSPLNLK